MSKVFNTTRLLSQVDSHLKTIRNSIRDKYSLEEARKLVPISELVQENLDVLEGDYQDNLLPLVVDWFSNKFFTWFSPPDCERCGRKLDDCSSYVNANGLLVEKYKCCNEKCSYTFDFIRHNDPAILLVTRQGRCGEWANCFGLILRALDYDTRLVLDITDHVWNEVWSESKGRWIHVDPCEATVDSPLLYEIGWTKKLLYCIAISEYGVLDVTRRYAVDFKATKLRRGSYDDRLIIEYMDKLSYKIINEITDLEKRSLVKKRRDADVELMKISESEKRDVNNPKEYSMRKTGSLSWRIQRGEYTPTMKSCFIIKVPSQKAADSHTNSELDESLFSLRYNSDKNKYECSATEYENLKGGWSSLAYFYENLDFKYERDWKTSYISRYDSCPPQSAGIIEWRFDLSCLEKRWKKLEIYVGGKVYPLTKITLKLYQYDKSDTENILQETLLELNSSNIITYEDTIPNATIFNLKAELSGGDPQDVVCWQKPQLFRQTRGKSSHEWTFQVKVH